MMNGEEKVNKWSIVVNIQLIMMNIDEVMVDSADTKPISVAHHKSVEILDIRGVLAWISHP